MFAFQDTQGPVEIAFTDRHGGTSGGPFASLNLTTATGDDPAAVRGNLAALGAGFAGDRPVRRLVLMHQVHGADVTVVDERCERRPDGPVPRCRPSTGWSPPCPTSRWWSGSPTASRCCWPTRRPAWSAPRTRVVPGLVAGVVPRTVAAMRALGADHHHRLGRARTCAGLLRGARADARRRGRGRPRGVRRDVLGHAVGRRRRRRARPAAAGRVPVVDASRCTIEDDDLFSLPPDGARRRAGWPGSCGAARERHRPPARRDRRHASRRSAAGSRRPARAPAGPPTRSPWSWSPSSSPPPTCACSPSSGCGRGGEQAPGGRGQGRRVRRPRPDLALHRRSAEQQGRRGRRATPTSWSRWTAPSCSAACPGAPTRPADGSTCLVQVSLDPTPGRRAARAPPRRRRRRSPSASRRPRGCGCAGVMAVAPLGGDPGAAFASWPRWPPRCAASTPPRTLGLGRDERRPRGRRRVRRDTRADRQRGAR